MLWDKESLEGVIIDPGAEIDRILNAIQSNRIQPKGIWLTHGHIDHAGGAMDLKEHLGEIPIIGPQKADTFLLENMQSQAHYFGLAGYFRNCRVDRFLEDGEILSFSNHTFQVLHCPGHTPGHVIYYSPENQFAQTGDTLFHGSVGSTNFPGGDYSLLISSIQKKLLPIKDNMHFICGHGADSHLEEERRNNPFLKNL